jgi:periplasmic divalent cation tolerance protein
MTDHVRPSDFGFLSDFGLRASDFTHPMQTSSRFHLVLVTTPDLKTARRLAGAALAARLIACANFVPRIESHYWWQGKIERGAEVLMIMKTLKARLPALEKLIVAEHPYDTPEFIVLTLRGGNRRYLAWLESACRPGKSV